MGSDKSQLDFVLDQIRKPGVVSAKAMFGEYGIYCDGKIVALFCDNRLFVKPTEGGKVFIQAPVEASPYPGAKPYYLIEDQIENGDWISGLIRVTAQELPMQRKKTRAGRIAVVRRKSRSSRRSSPGRS